MPDIPDLYVVAIHELLLQDWTSFTFIYQCYSIW